MRELKVLFDARCGTCRRARRWLERHEQLVPLVFVPLQSPAARRLVPSLSEAELRIALTVVGSDGAVWRGEKAFLMCLWALRKYRLWAHRLAAPTLYPLARRLFRRISRRRARCESSECEI